MSKFFNLYDYIKGLAPVGKPFVAFREKGSSVVLHMDLSKLVGVSPEDLWKWITEACDYHVVYFLPDWEAENFINHAEGQFGTSSFYVH